MKIAALSDLHGVLPKIEPCDYVFICGDISPLDIQRSIVLMRDWLVNTFCDWVNNIQCKKVIMIAGNHDFCLLDIWQNEVKHNKYIIHPTGNKLKVLENNSTIIYDNSGKEYTVWGSPYCHIFGSWPFMYEDDILKNGFNTMPENCDFVLTHDAPYGCSDIILQIPYNKRCPDHIGNKVLRDVVLNKQPKILLHGHLHSTNHDCEMLGNTEVYNVSILDEYYDYVYPIKYFEINEK